MVSNAAGATVFVGVVVIMVCDAVDADVFAHCCRFIVVCDAVGADVFVIVISDANFVIVVTMFAPAIGDIFG